MAKSGQKPVSNKLDVLRHKLLRHGLRSWVAVEELERSYYNEGFLFFTIYPYYDNPRPYHGNLCKITSSTASHFRGFTRIRA